MEKNYWKIGVLIFIFFGLVVAGTLAVQKLKVPLGQPAKAQAELSKTETAELEKPKQETENTELKKASKAKENEVSAKPPEPKTEDSPLNTEPEKPSMGISLADRDKKNFNWSLGLLAEANMNSPEACAIGTGLYTLLCFL